MTGTRKTHLVIGASRGIGFAIANKLTEGGTHVIGVGRSETPERGSKFQYLNGDVHSDELLTRDVSNELKQEKISGLVMAVGVSIASNTLDARDRFVESFKTNVIGPYNAVLGLSDALAVDASIVFVASINAIQGFPGNPGYVSSKSAIAGLVRALAVDFGPRRVRVNGLCLGYFPTDMTKASFEDEVEKTKRANRTCLGRWGTLEEAADAAEFLISNRSSYVTGQCLVVDGGWVAKGL